MKYDTLEAFWKALNTVASKSMNMEAALRFRKIIRTAKPVVDDFFEVRNKLVNEYGEGPEGQKSITPDKSPRWNEFLTGPYGDLLKQVVPDEAFSEKISIKDLWTRGANGQREQIEIAPLDLELISDVIIFED